MTIPEYIEAAGKHWMEWSGKSLFRFCGEIGIDAGKEWARMIAGKRVVTVKVLFRVQSVSEYSLDHLDTRYNYALEQLPTMKKWRLARKLSQSACADAIGMSIQSYDTMETTHKIDRCSFKAEKMLKVADLLAGKIHIAKKVNRPEHYADEETPPKSESGWNIRTATDAEIMQRVDKVWRCAMLGGRKLFSLKQLERGLFTASGDTVDYVVDVRKAPFLFRATMRYAGTVLCERYI